MLAIAKAESLAIFAGGVELERDGIFALCDGYRATILQTSLHTPRSSHRDKLQFWSPTLRYQWYSVAPSRLMIHDELVELANNFSQAFGAFVRTNGRWCAVGEKPPANYLSHGGSVAEFELAASAFLFGFLK